MAVSTVPVDLFNPGQVFACIGFAEAAGVLRGEARGAFDWSEPQAVFRVEAPGSEDPVSTVLSFLAEGQVESLGVHPHTTEKTWKVTTQPTERGGPFPTRPPDSPAALPAVLTCGSRQLRFDHWGDATQRDNVKFWAGSGGYPGAALLRDALDLVRADLPEAATEDPFSLSVRQTSSFRFDWRRDYVPIDIGFSLNAHGHIEPRGFPLVEILAAYGLGHARPEGVDKLKYRYGVLGTAAPEALPPLPLLRASLGAPREQLPLPLRTFTMFLDWPGQEDQARCITNVTEETTR